MSVRAKFKCEVVVSRASGAEIDLTPVTNGSDENKEFYAYTPSGSIKLSTVNAEAAKQFIPGKEYYVDFTPADAPEKVALRVVGFADRA
jgi:hypothetical protein